MSSPRLSGTRPDLDGSSRAASAKTGTKTELDYSQRFVKLIPNRAGQASELLSRIWAAWNLVHAARL